MRITLVALLVWCAHLCVAKDLVVGSRINNLLISTEKIEYSKIPLIRRDKDYSYFDQKERVIKGIIARDLLRSDAEVTVTDGGVGEAYVRLHVRSERGVGLKYLIMIFSDNK